MNWLPLLSLESLDSLDKNSFSKTQLIFKHSTRCHISTTVESRLNSAQTTPLLDCYFLDLIAHRDVSNAIAEKYKVHHESPQVILVKNGECIYDESHLAIMWNEILEQVIP